MYQIIGEYLEYLELEKGLSQNTLDAYRRDLENFSDNLNTEDIKSVDRLMINTYVRTLREKKFAPTSIIRKVASLRGFFKWATSVGILEKKSCFNSGTAKSSPKTSQGDNRKRYRGHAP